MVRGLLAFGVAFTASAALAMLSSGCAFGDDCDCPSYSPRPRAQAPLEDLGVASYDERGNLAETPVKPEGGTIEVTGDAVLIVYQQGGVEHRVRYAVTGRE
jgi:hypothetical protein